MKIGDLVKYVPALEGETDVHVGVIVGLEDQWWKVLWIGDIYACGYTADSLEVINESR